MSEDSGSSTNGTWGIATTGLTINNGDATFDFFDNVLVTQTSIGLPLTYSPTDGNFMAYQLQNGPENHRMYQDVLLPADATTLTWDMFYQNHAGVFASGDQELKINIRDFGDNVLTTLFLTTPGDPLSIPMSSFSANIAPYAGTFIRLDVEMIVLVDFFDAGFDNFRISAVPEPGAITFLSCIGLVGLFSSTRRKRNVAV